MAILPGMIVSLRAIVIDASGETTAGVRVLDNNNGPVTPKTTLPQGIMEVLAQAFVINDVVQNVETGITAVVLWIDPNNALRWAATVTGENAQFAIGWTKIGTFTPA